MQQNGEICLLLLLLPQPPLLFPRPQSAYGVPVLGLHTPTLAASLFPPPSLSLTPHLGSLISRPFECLVIRLSCWIWRSRYPERLSRQRLWSWRPGPSRRPSTLTSAAAGGCSSSCTS
ncbi:unnamed protein product [Musa textilis]